MWEILLSLLFPKRCVSCGRFGSYFCPSCLSQIKLIRNPICPVCERPAIGGATHPKCRGKYRLDGLVSACVYEGPIKAAIHRLKYRPWITDLGEILAGVVGQYLRNNTSNYIIKAEPIITAVSLHPARERQRGFNQSALIGKLLAKKLNLKFSPNLLVRRKKTRPQADLKGKDRQENIRGAFIFNHNSSFLIHNSNILLVDDVWTTGATLSSCALVLKKAGAREVWSLTLAR